MKQHIYPNDYKNVEPSNYRLAHNPTGLLFNILQKKFKCCLTIRHNNG